jgi:polar amino acid transport system substrate-binding protein
MVARYAAACLLILLAVAIGPALGQEPGCEPGKAAVKCPSNANKVVKIAVSPLQPPYAFSDPASPDRLLGLEVEMITKAMECAGLKYEFVKGAWSGLLAALFNGSTDIMIGAVNYRPDRAERADFIVYMRAGQSMEVQKGNPRKLTNPDNLCGATGSATTGSSSAMHIERLNKACLDANKPGITFLPAVDGNAAFRQVANARVDFALDDAASAGARLLKEPGIEVVYTAATDIVAGMVVTKGNAEMAKIVLDGLRVQERDGTLVALAKNYGFPTELLLPVQIRH